MTIEHPIFKRDILEEGLTIHEKARILKNNIFGVDIDPQATEITMMSLYLKALEGERGRLPRKQHLLPSLGNNIKCGNSLIGYDILEGKLFDDDTKSRINPFEWNSKSVGFGEIMENGGFDVVIGNPPYVRQETIGEFKEYFQGRYEVYQGTADLYAYFIEKGVSLLRDKGLFSYIVANKWMRANYGMSLRRWLKKQRIEEITDFGDLPVFEGATTYTCIIRIRKASAASHFKAIKVDTLNFNNLTDYAADIAYRVNKTSLSDKGWSLADEQSQKLFDKLRSISVPLRMYVKERIFYGIKTGLNEAFVINDATRDKLIAEDAKSSEVIKPFLVGKDIKRFDLPCSDKYLIFTRRGIDIKKYPAIERHLLAYKKQLTPKPANWKGGEWPGRKAGTYKWYEIQDAVDYYSEFDKPKILWPGISSEVTAFAFDEKGFYGNDNTQLIIANDRYLLGLLNSRLMRFILTHICDKVQGGFYRPKIIYIDQLPIRRIELNNPSEKAVRDMLVSLVDCMLNLHKKKNSLPPFAEREKIEREIAVTDEKIDDIVYGLYGVTEEERKIIKG